MAGVPPPPTGVSAAGPRPQPTPHLLPLVLLGRQLVQDARLHHLRTARARVTGSSSSHRTRASTGPETLGWPGRAAPRGTPGTAELACPCSGPYPGLSSPWTPSLSEGPWGSQGRAWASGGKGLSRGGKGALSHRAARGWEVVEKLRTTRESGGACRARGHDAGTPGPGE